MKKHLLLTLGLLLITLSSYLFAQNYVGSEVCQPCHSSIYESYMKTGHPYKLTKITGGPPTYPEGTSPGVPDPPEDMTWADVSYVIGGFGWKARFMDSEGYILTGDSIRQYNLANSTLGTDAHWVGYDADKAPRKPYTCGGCHTTGWVASDSAGPHQDDLPGIYGTWAEPGVRCEACHGPASDHISNPQEIKPSKEEQCNNCHARGDVNQIDAKNGLIKHHEQYEDLLASPHKTFSCGTCHEPHLSTKYEFGGYKGKESTCAMCHSDIEIKIPAKADFECSTCHMPFAAKSAVAITIEYSGGSVPKGDIRTHIQRINTNPDWNMFTDDGKYVRLDEDGKAYITLEYTCLSCHTSKDKAWAAANAEKIHETGEVGVTFDDKSNQTLTNYALYQNYPNPFNPRTTISFDIKEDGVVEIKLFNARGQEITTLMNEHLSAGNHKLTFSASDLPSGIYIYQIKANNFVASKKMVLMK